MRPWKIYALVFFGVLLVYFLANPKPSDMFKHYVYIADALISRRFNIVGLPEHYGDYINTNGKIYFQYGPVPAIILLPFVYFWKTGLSQTYVSMFLGAVNSVLMLMLLKRVKAVGFKTALLLTVFFAFGTVHFSAASTGSTWFFEHIVAVFFLLLAILECLGKRRPLVLGILFSLSVYSRQTIFLSMPFFLLYLKKGQSWKEFIGDSALMAMGILPLFLFNAYYNYVRFGNFLDDGRYFMYLNYVNSFAPYTFMRLKDPEFRTGMLDLRNIPLNLYTFLLMPPVADKTFPFIKPSPYGLSVLITSPLFIYAFLARKEFLVKASFLVSISVAMAGFLWFSQGWVQFGYRYLLDYIPFLMILLAFGIGRFTGLKIILLVISLIVNAWGIFYVRV